MYELIIEIFHGKLFGCSSNVSILKPVSLLVAINARHADIRPYVELSFLVQKGHDIFLDDMGTRTTHLVGLVS